mgnify:CR=1 FL=1
MEMEMLIEKEKNDFEPEFATITNEAKIREFAEKINAQIIEPTRLDPIVAKGNSVVLSYVRL